MINNIVPTFPVCADKGTEYPYAIYRKINYTPSYTKDRNDYQDTINYEIVVFSAKYKEGIELAEKINDKLELARGTWKDLLIHNIWLVNSSEYYDGESYVQNLIYKIDIDNTKF